MILLDTHIWYRWVDEQAKLTPKQLRHLQDNEPTGLGVSIISCWEIAKLVSLGRLTPGRALPDWMTMALTFRGCQLLHLTPEIAIEANQLPGTFHRDPADQILVATARILGISMLTADAKILAYPHVNLLV
jgi:PIN domain nuclease of toxin-antitoxin system